VGQPPFYERYRFPSDSTLEIEYLADSTLTQTTGHGRVYVENGKIYHETGDARWTASQLDSTGVTFEPSERAVNRFSWEYRSPDEWTARLSTPQRPETLYHMRRIP
jgi:hypothetical protein